jgi:hypothetical protein
MRIRFPKLRAPMLDAVMLAGLALIVNLIGPSRVRARLLPRRWSRTPRRRSQPIG